MATLFFILVLLSIYHLFYEAVLAPTLRVKYRYKLFEYRDKLIRMKIDSQDMPQEVFDNVLFYINSSINRLPYLKLSLCLQAKREFDTNATLKKKVENRTKIIEATDNPEIKAIMSGISSITFSMFILNFGSVILYFIPIYLLCIIMQKFFSFALEIKKILQDFNFVPDKDFERLSTC